MGYIETVLERDESVLHRGHLHWIVYAPAVALAFLGFVAIAGLRDRAGALGVGAPIGVLLVLAALMAWLDAWITRLTTEIAVTSRRVIVKRGLIRRSTMEMNAGRIESVQVDQSIAGRCVGFGTVTIRGTGAGIEPIAKVAAPLAMREAVGRLASGRSDATNSKRSND
jgi:uncharacterized membrane protein YdbT with pleckstrin-like domain